MNNYTADCDCVKTNPAETQQTLSSLAAGLDNQVLRTMEIARAVASFLVGNEDPQDRGIPSSPKSGILENLSGTLSAAAHLRIEVERIAAMLGVNEA